MGRLVADGWFYRNLLSTINIPILLPRSGVVKAHLAISAHSLTLNFMSSYFTPLSSQCPGVDGELIPSPPLPEKRKEIVSWRFPRKVKAQGGPVERRPKASKEKKSGSSGKWGGAASQRQAMETAALCKPWKNK